MVKKKTDQCEAITESGKRCENKSKGRSKFCGIHKKSRSKTVKKKTNKENKHEIVVRVQGEPVVKEKDLMPTDMGKGKNKYSLTKTWLSEKQLIRVLQKTPPQHVHKRKGRGGMEFEYVTGTYMKKCLNYAFGWNWDFEIIEENVYGLESKNGQIVVKGRLTVKNETGEHTITKTQYGGAEVKYLRESKKPMDLGNDFKAAATDALKKCAAELGFASDIYGKNEFRDIGRIVDDNDNDVPPPKSGGVPCVGYDDDGCPGGIVLTDGQAKYSKKLHGKPLCSTCQASLKNE